MNYERLLEKRDRYQANRSRIPEYALQSFEQAFEVEYTHNSTAIEGNTLTLIETKLVLEDGISVGGKALQELYEVVNHRNAYRYIKNCIEKEEPLSEKIVKDIHALLMDHIFTGGIYRNVDVYISGAQHTPPSPDKMYHQVKNFYAELAWKCRELNPIELAAWTHAEFVRIHPFPDGNGRTSRLMMNYQLLANGFPAISIAKESRLEYFNTLEAYVVEGKINPLVEILTDLIDMQLNRYLQMVPTTSSEGISL